MGAQGGGGKSRLGHRPSEKSGKTQCTMPVGLDNVASSVKILRTVSAPCWEPEGSRLRSEWSSTLRASFPQCSMELCSQVCHPPERNVNGAPYRAWMEVKLLSVDFS